MSSTGLMWRVFEIVVVLGVLILAVPLILAFAVWIRLDSPGPAVFRQTRVGLNGQPFPLFKLRTLEVDSEHDAVTPEGDDHITRIGRTLRRYRLDELPQLIDILAGHMSLVGPRPELAVDLAHVDPALREQFLTIKPGLTGPVQLDFIAEDGLLAACADPADAYRTVLVPAKVAANLRAFEQFSVWARLGCLLRTPWTLASQTARRGSRTRVAAHLGDHIREP